MWKMSFCDSDQKSMLMGGFLACNDSVMSWGSKLVYLGGSHIGPLSHLQRVWHSRMIPHNPISVTLWQARLQESGSLYRINTRIAVYQEWWDICIYPCLIIYLCVQWKQESQIKTALECKLHWMDGKVNIWSIIWSSDDFSAAGQTRNLQHVC